MTQTYLYMHNFQLQPEPLHNAYYNYCFFKDGKLTNIYCFACTKWLTHYYWSTHVENKRHFKKCRNRYNICEKAETSTPLLLMPKNTNENVSLEDVNANENVSLEDVNSAKSFTHFRIANGSIIQCSYLHVYLALGGCPLLNSNEKPNYHYFDMRINYEIH